MKTTRASKRNPKVKITISDRLKAVTCEIQYRSIADIGTDHAYIPIYAALTDKISRAIACDLHAGPLETARRNIQNHGLSDIIETRSGYGLTPLLAFEAKTVVIAGMGGMLTIDILENGRHTVSSVKQLVLQPQLDIPSVRKYVHSIGFTITNEVMLREDGKYYTILNCIRNNALSGGESPYTEAEYEFGNILIERKDPVLKSYLTERLEKLRGISGGISVSGNLENGRPAFEKLELTNAAIKMMEEVLSCL